MTDIFISCRGTDSAKAERIGTALRAQGFDVGFNGAVAAEARSPATATMSAGQAKVVLVLWSASSVKTKRVLQEAAAARSRRALVQALLAPVPPPAGYETEPLFDLSGWSGDRSDARWVALVALLKSTAGGRPAAGRIAMDRRTLVRSWKRFFGVLAALVTIVGGLQTFGIVDVAELINPKASAEQVEEWNAVRNSRDCGRIRAYMDADLNGPFVDQADALLGTRRIERRYRWEPFAESLPATGVSQQAADTSQALACATARDSAETTARENCALFRGSAGDRRNLAATVPEADCSCQNAAGHWQCTISTAAQCRGEQQVEYEVEVCGG